MPLVSTICKIYGCFRMTSSSGWQNGKRNYRTLCEDHRRPSRSTYNYNHEHKGICEDCNSKGRTHFHRLNGFHSEYIEGNVIEVCLACHSKFHNKVIY